jgi:HTH-type transcriptional regulator/antitoxin HigA
MQDMNEPVDVQHLLPAWEQFRAATDISPIRDEGHSVRMTKILEGLLDEVGLDENHPIMGLIDIVGDLVDDYEQQCNSLLKPHPLPQTNGVDALKFLMEQHKLKQADLCEIGSQGVVSEILTGKRELNLRQVRALSERFGVSADTFL